MKNHIVSLFKLAIVSLAAYPALVLAAPAAGSAYYTDQTNSYVQDQTSKIMGNLNNILCFMGGMAPDQMVNAGNYIALVDKNACDTGGSGGQSGNTGAAYTTVVVNSARASSTTDMVVKAWLDFPENNQKISVYATASQAPSASLPYGVFRMDFCADTTDCTLGRGFINAPSTGGLSFYDGGTYGGQTYSTALQLNATSATEGSGIAQDINPWDGNSNFYFAYNSTHFIRSDGVTSTCFDRDDAVADESVWRYGLYNATTGAQITRNSGFPIEYDNGAGVISNGYIGYYGMWMPVTVPTGATVNQVTYSSSGATKTPYTLLKTGGKLNKFTTVLKTLADLHKVTFWYYAQQNVGAAMTAGSQYELYWDNTTTPKQFYVSGAYNPTTNNMEPLTTPVALDNAAMAAATPWGLFGWSQMMGGQFGIKGSDFINLATNTSTTPVVTQIQDVVYPSDYAAIGGNGKLNCINDCPTAALITTSNTGTGSAYSNQGWTPVSTTLPYTFDATTKNMEDATLADVISAATSGTNANGVRSGRLVTDTDMADIISAKSAFCTTYSIIPCTYNQGDVDLLPEGRSYYVWETGGNSWNQLAILMNGATPVAFEAPLQVNFTVPTGAKYGSYQGATISLQYGGFGDLWGIPNECIDITTNAACDFTPTTGTAQNNMRWTSKFSIPYDANGVVTSGSTTYWVKPLDKEVRLAKVLCSATTLTAPAAGSVTLPNITTDWLDPTVAGKTTGSAPTVTAAPQVIHGVKQY